MSNEALSFEALFSEVMVFEKLWLISTDLISVEVFFFYMKIVKTKQNKANKIRIRIS